MGESVDSVMGTAGKWQEKAPGLAWGVVGLGVGLFVFETAWP